MTQTHVVLRPFRQRPIDSDIEEGDNGDSQQPRRKMHIEQIYDYLQDAVATGVSMSSLAEIRKRENHGGVKSGSVNFWQRKCLQMSFDQTKPIFEGSNAIHLVTDESTHGGYHVMVTCFFNPIQGIGCMGTCQEMWPAKIVTPGEFQVTSEIARALARREAERVSAYKVIQAISYQLDLITSGRLTMESFKMSQSESILVTPLKPGDTRWVSGQEIFVQYAGTAVAATFRCAIDCHRPMLISLMDQSATNMAAASYLQSKGFNCSMQWDKIHRLVRDIKLSQEASDEKCLVKSHLASMYLFGINYRPFGSGGFFREKQAIVASFFETESVVLWHKLS